MSERQLFDAKGRRKYLTAEETERALHAAERAERETRRLCYMLAYPGCGISEALGLTADRVDLDQWHNRLSQPQEAPPRHIQSRAGGRPRCLETLDLVHDLKAVQRRPQRHSVRLWPWERMTGWRRVMSVMRKTGLNGPQATPKGLRHGFGVQAVNAGVPLNMVQKWLAHAQFSTTAIYADAVGAQEQAIASRMWR